MLAQFERFNDPLEKVTAAEATRRLIVFYGTSRYSYAAQEKIEEISEAVRALSFLPFWELSPEMGRGRGFIHILLRSQKGTVLEWGGSQAGFLMQAFTLTRRSFVNMSRDLGYYWLRLLVYIVVTICIGTIYLNVGTSYNSILVTAASVQPLMMLY